MVGWVCGVVVLGQKLGIWHAELATDTVFWFVASGLVLFGSFDNVAKERHFFRRKAAAVLGASAFVEVASELFVMRLLLELALVAVAFVLSGVQLVPSNAPDTERAKKLANALLTSLGLGFLVFVLIQVVLRRHALHGADIGRQFLLPIWLTIGFLPFIYVVGLASSYELAFMRLDFRSQDRSRWRRAIGKALIVTTFRLRIRRLGAFDFDWSTRLGEARTLREGRAVLRQFRSRQRDVALAESIVESNLVRYAGSVACNQQGCRLDRSGFDVTMRALDLVAMEMLVSHDGSRYRDDLFQFDVGQLDRIGFPKADQGIELSRKDDGAAWFAWSRTSSGWVFAVGGDHTVTTEFEYDGPEPPAGFPGEWDQWDSDLFLRRHSPNWRQ